MPTSDLGLGFRVQGLGFQRFGLRFIRLRVSGILRKGMGSRACGMRSLWTGLDRIAHTIVSLALSLFMSAFHTG